MRRTVGIAIDDVELLAVDDTGRVLAEVPGLALVHEGQVLVGREAAALARQAPRFAHDRFWEQLDARPMGRPFPEPLSTADLAHAHLWALWQAVGTRAEEAVFAVPGFMGERSVGQLLGIAESIGLTVAGLVDSALSTLAVDPPEGSVVVLQLFRRRYSLSAIETEPSLHRVAVVPGERFGLSTVREMLVGKVAEAFIKRSRFDPLHSAQVEQLLDESLDGWMGRAEASGSVLATLKCRGQEPSLELTRAELVGWARPFVEELARQAEALLHAEVRSIVVSPRVRLVPGLLARLSSLGPSVLTLPQGACASGALAAREALRASGGARTLVTRLPRQLPQPERPVTPPVLFPPQRPTIPAGSVPRERLSATHVLVNGIAHAITEESLTLGAVPPQTGRGVGLGGAEAGVSAVHCRLFVADGAAMVEDLSRTGTFVNELRVRPRAPLWAGDRLRLGHPGLELQLIRLGAA